MGPQNAALFGALTDFLDTKIDNKFKVMQDALRVVAESSDASFTTIRRELEKERRERKDKEVDIDKRFDELKQRISGSAGQQASASTLGPAPEARSKSVGARGNFRPGKVFVQGFYKYADKTGGLTIQERDALAARVSAKVPAELKDTFKLETRYNETRRLVFTTEDVGESCWEFREKLIEEIKTQGITQNGQELKVFVEEEPAQRSKKREYWKAVDALRTMAKEEEDFLLKPSAFGIYDAKEFELLGRATTDMYEWDAEVVKKGLASN
eukprot:9405124-Karenia_brevis.AAC.1